MQEYPELINRPFAEPQVFATPSIVDEENVSVPSITVQDKMPSTQPRVINIPRPPIIKAPPSTYELKNAGASFLSDSTPKKNRKTKPNKAEKKTQTTHIPSVATGWAPVATEIKKMMEYPGDYVMHIAVEGYTILVIDPRYNAFSWNAPLNEFPENIGITKTELRKVEASDPAALQGAGEELGPLLWLIGNNAYSGEPAPWLRKSERYKLMRWPDLTRFNPSLDQIYLTSIIGTTPASIDELVLSSGAPEEEVINTINALSLMGILSVHPFQGAAGGYRFRKQRSDGLFAKLRKKIGW